MIQDIKEVVFTMQHSVSDGENTFDDPFDELYDETFYECNNMLESEYYIIKTNENKFHKGSFKTGFFDEAICLENRSIKSLIEDLENSFVLSELRFTGIEEDGETDINIDDIVWIDKIDNDLTLSLSINNDKEQPIRAIMNYIDKEKYKTSLSEIEFYQLIIDSASHLLKMSNQDCLVD